MTGMTARNHGDRNFNETLPMPDAPTLPACFREAGYQTYAVGKLHVYPQRSRIGFDDVLLFEEGRRQFGLGADDWEHDVARAGYAGMEHAGGACSNDYNVVPWHLPDELHPINWTAKQMCRVIHRRDPTRPAFWYLSFSAPHPPLVPLDSYLRQYQDVEIDPPVVGEWAKHEEQMPWMLRSYEDGGQSMRHLPPHATRLARQAFYATLTHLDHQIRVVIGTLREQGLLDNTIIAFTSDHGEMLGDHGRWAKTLMYEMSAKVPLIVVPAAEDRRILAGHHDDRLITLEDVMPTLLELADIPIPNTVDGRSLIGDSARDILYGEHWGGTRATRMVRDKRYKLIYYPVGHRTQLFDLLNDPRESRNLADKSEFTDIQERLTFQLIKNLYEDDWSWIASNTLVGLPDRSTIAHRNRGLSGQRGIRFT